MKKIFTKKTRIGFYTLCLLLVTGLSSCDFSGLNDAVDNFAVVVKLEPINTNSTVLLTDANTGELISQKVAVSFSGDNGDDVIDIYSDPISEESVTNGVLNFGISNSVTPSETAPVNVTLVMQADGYLTTTRTVTLSREGDNNFSFKMINESNPPKGVQIQTNSDANAGTDGALTADYEMTVSSQENSDAGASIQIPSGTIFTDADGNTLTGQLTTHITYYDPSEPDAMESIPTEMVTDDGEQFVTFGTISLQITDAQGHVATSFAAPKAKTKTPTSSDASETIMKFNLLVSQGVFNPGSGRPMARGDFARLAAKLIDVNKLVSQLSPFADLTFQEDLLEQKYIEAAIKAGLIESMQDDIMHSFPQLDIGAFATQKIMLSAGLPGNSCEGSITLNRSGYTGNITGTASAPGFSKTVSIPSDVNSYKATFPNLNFTYKLETSYGTVTGTHNFCSEGNLDITLPAPPPTVIDATVNVSLTCQNPDEKVAVTDIPGASVVYRKTDAPDGTSWRVATNLQWDYDKENQKLSGGSFDVSSVEKGADYTFKVIYDNKTYEKVINISGETVGYSETITDDVCQ